MNFHRMGSSKMKLADFVIKDNKCICTRFARLTCAEHAEQHVREAPGVSTEANPPIREEPEPKRLFEIELKNFIKKHNKCLCVLYDRLACGEHGKYLPIVADPQHISFPGPIRILFDFLGLILSTHFNFKSYFNDFPPSGHFLIYKKTTFSFL